MNQTATLIQAEKVNISPEERTNWKADIARGIDLLDEQEKMVIALHYHEELTLAEISQVLDIAETEVKKIRDSTIQKLLS
jgi:RNA polymerase sigma factor (sigma-70 family)